MDLPARWNLEMEGTEMSRLLTGCAIFAVAVISWDIFLSQPASAGSMTLKDLINNKGSLTVGDKTFSNFMAFSSTPTGGAMAVDPGSITVSTLTANTDGPGLMFVSPMFFATTGQTLSVLFTYTVSTVSGKPLIKDDSLDSTSLGRTGVGSRVSVSETTATPFTSNLIFASPTQSRTSDFSFFPTNLATVVVSSSVQFVGGTTDGSGATVGSFNERFSEVVPEPSSLVLACCGVVMALGWWHRRMKR
jgi:hypothetical protein